MLDHHLLTNYVTFYTYCSFFFIVRKEKSLSHLSSHGCNSFFTCEGNITRHASIENSSDFIADYLYITI